jgi:hypothetical protein
LKSQPELLKPKQDIKLNKLNRKLKVSLRDKLLRTKLKQKKPENSFWNFKEKAKVSNHKVKLLLRQKQEQKLK